VRKKPGCQWDEDAGHSGYANLLQMGSEEEPTKVVPAVIKHE
jgi:hypothetical protein